jgi:hypothetical protein
MKNDDAHFVYLLIYTKMKGKWYFKMNKDIYIYIDRKMWNVFISWSFTLDGFIDEEEEKKERNDQFSLSFMT